MKEIKDLQEEYCKLIAEIVQEMLLLGFKVREVVDKGLVWSCDPSDPHHRDVMAYAMAGNNEFWLIEITPEIIAVKTPEDEQVLHYRYLTTEGVVISGFTLEDLPYLRYGPKMIEAAKKHFKEMLIAHLMAIKSQPDFENASQVIKGLVK